MNVGNIAIANMLIQGGANVNLLNEYNQTVLQAIAYDGKNQLEIYFTNNFLKNQFISIGHDEFAALLIENGALVNIVDFQGETALHHAVNNSDL